METHTIAAHTTNKYPKCGESPRPAQIIDRPKDKKKRFYSTMAEKDSVEFGAYVMSLLGLPQ